MKILQSSFFRALTAIAVGVLLIKYPDNTVTGIVIAIGVLFLLSGLVSLLSYLNARRHMSDYKIFDAAGRQVAGQAPVFPIVGIGSMILGGILAVMPNTFISALMYVIGAILILGAVNQYFAIITARRYGSVSLWYWVCPTLILLVGAYVIIKPMTPLSLAMLMLGYLTLFYGIVEAANTLLFNALRSRWEKKQEAFAQMDEPIEAEEVASEIHNDEPDASSAAPTKNTPATVE